jgi:hypothetical protein
MLTEKLRKLTPYLMAGAIALGGYACKNKPICWNKTYGEIKNNEEHSLDENSIDELFSITQLDDGGYVAAGSTRSENEKGIDGWILRLNSQGELQWKRSLGIKGDDRLHSVVESAKGGFVAAGYLNPGFVRSSVTSHRGSDGWVVALDAEGKVKWQKNYGGNKNETLSGIIRISDNKYIAVGTTSKPLMWALKLRGASKASDYRNDGWILKLDEEGNLEWEKTFGGEENDSFSSVDHTANGGFVVAGSTYSKGAGESEGWILKFDVEGNLEWEKTYGGSGYDTLNSVRIIPEQGGYIVAGSTNSRGAGESDGWLLKLDAQGDLEWEKTYGGTDSDGLSSVELFSDGGYLAVGYKGREYEGEMGASGVIIETVNAWILNLDKQGNVKKDTLLERMAYEGGFAILATDDEGYIFAGSVVAEDDMNSDARIVKMNHQGDTYCQ